MTTIAIIPARGGSKGIPRKNLRPLAGKPLIYYSIQACLNTTSIDKTIVTTDDDEIALIAKRFGATVLMRDPSLADDFTTLDDVILATVKQFEAKFDIKLSLIVTVQPTSPLITSKEIETAVFLLSQGHIDTVLSVVDDRHLNWTETKEGNAFPLYKQRVNRQQLEPNFKETGAIIACTRAQLKKGTRIGNKVKLLTINKNQSFDIDDFSDFYLCESMLKRKKIVITVVGYDEVGLGHAFRAVMIASELINYELVFVCEEKSNLAKEYIESFNYNVHLCANGELINSVLSYNPDLIINDILDTTSEYVASLKKSGAKVVNFEDLGTGYEMADLVINALYPSPLPSKHVKVGSKYFCLRDEFLYPPINKTKKDNPQTLLVTFGGVDEGNLTERVAELILPWCEENKIQVTIVLGPGYAHQNLLQQSFIQNSKWIEIIKNTKRISDYMINATVAVTSGGRTVLELASLTVPHVVICQNTREELHTLASEKNGVINLGFRNNVNDGDIHKSIVALFEDKDLASSAKQKLKSLDLTKGKARVCKLITSLID